MNQSTKMTREDLIKKLKDIAASTAEGGDVELNHEEADGLLLEYIDDPDVTDAFGSICKLYC